MRVDPRHSEAAALFQAVSHRRTYEEATGRDRWNAQAVNGWVSSTLRNLLSGTAYTLLDVGCAEQPFRPLVEAAGCRYVGMDIAQNSTSSVATIASIEDALAPGEPYDILLCTEVLEHVANIDAAFAGLRRQLAPGGRAVLTVPFVFPLHAEPSDFRRLTQDGVAELARRHGFTVEQSTRLGTATDVLATLVADLSILPARRSFGPRAKTWCLRAAATCATRLLESGALRRNVAINSNTYLSNGIVLRAT